MRFPIRSIYVAGVAATLAWSPAFAEDSDADFAKQAANDGMLEVELGRLASKQAADPDVREFGARMVADHGKANQELQVAAKRAGIAVPTALDADHREELDRMSKLSGAEFDEAYTKMMVEDHQKTVEKLREQAADAESEIDRWAAKTLPTVEHHLAQARMLAQGKETSATGERERTGRLPSDLGADRDASGGSR